jgi:hydrogenase nickel incorporation protein HypA/HybF
VHELAIIEAVVDQVTERLGDQRVSAIHLAVGKLSGVVPDALRFCFELATSDTTMDGAALTIEEPPGQGECRSCGREFPIPDAIALCPCGSADVRIVGGAELVIRSVVLA